MEILKKEWYPALLKRRSRRQFNGQPLSREMLKKLSDFIEKLNGCIEGVRAVLLTDNPEKVFKGIVGSYGKIKNAPAYFAFIGDLSNPQVQENTGYLGECCILEATSMGLGTCWVGGFFNSELVEKKVDMLPSEKVLAISPVGYCGERYTLEEKLMASLPGSSKRKSLDVLCKGLPKDQWPKWMCLALESARLAPSAINRQPWRFALSDESITISVDSPKFSAGISKRLDCGITMLHLEIGAFYAGVKGRFEILEGLEVAKFTV